MSDPQLNFSIGVLIILLILFWSLANAITPSCTTRKGSAERFGVPTSNLTYGNTQMQLGNDRGVRYIYDNINNVIEVPNSQTAMRKLFDEADFTCENINVDLDLDQRPSQIFLSKASSRNKGASVPRSMTATRENMLS
jgi:hypothetical protein